MYHICAVGRCDKNCNDTWVPPAHYDMKLYSYLVRQMTWSHNAADHDDMFNKPENEIKNKEYKREPIFSTQWSANVHVSYRSVAPKWKFTLRRNTSSIYRLTELSSWTLNFDISNLAVSTTRHFSMSEYENINVSFSYAINDCINTLHTSWLGFHCFRISTGFFMTFKFHVWQRRTNVLTTTR